ncbi:type 4a pilus biogenesis protein PilO [Clostridium disporicum]|uniref:Pilus assembly protein, PilO n=1 Tax=Clostridium disporicum TaxID=84024 RepID=A0A174HQ04_9CLOT|nr:type 4a pilus biogenesis protein PilO [Clostridium disporicum]MDY3360344.1 type 4a pilus biogenesis protein PilO [Clostridium celatum]CUO75606.1 Pilus assembly protein%2C PilO [Clostridium disporicum]
MEQELNSLEQPKRQNKVVEWLKAQSKKDKIILASTTIIVSVVLSLRFAILPQLEIYTNNLMRLDQLNAEVARVKRLPQENKILEEKAEELQVLYENALVKLPKTPELAQVAYDIRYFVRDTNVELFSLGFSEGQVGEDEIAKKDEVKTDENGVVTEIDRGLEGGNTQTTEVAPEQAVSKQVVSISVSGLHKDIMSFIKKIENYSRIADVSNISLSKGEDKKLNASITANFYNLNYEEKENYEFNDGIYGREDSFN